MASVGACSAWIARTLGRPRDVLLAALLMVVLHACYGAGVVRGVIERRRPTPAPEARPWLGPVPSRHGAAAELSAPTTLVSAPSAGDEEVAHRAGDLP